MADRKGWKGVNYRDKDSREEVRGAHDATAEVEHVDKNYDLHLYKGMETTDQGLLIVAELKPKVGSLPSFSFRWDERDSHLNVDIHGVGRAEERWFRKGIRGYGGHVGQKIGDQSRIFEVDIWIPSMRVFKGHLKFNLGYSIAVTEKIVAKVNGKDWMTTAL